MGRRSWPRARFPSIKGSVDEFGFMFGPNVEELGDAMEAVVAEERGSKCGEYARGMFTARKMAMAYERLFLCFKILLVQRLA